LPMITNCFVPHNSWNPSESLNVVLMLKPCPVNTLSMVILEREPEPGASTVISMSYTGALLASVRSPPDSVIGLPPAVRSVVTLI